MFVSYAPVHSQFDSFANFDLISKLHFLLVSILAFSYAVTKPLLVTDKASKLTRLNNQRTTPPLRMA